MGKDYSELEGKEVEFKLIAGGSMALVVAGCDYDIGITLCKKDDKSHNMICYNGPSSPEWKNHDSKDGLLLKVYKAMFYHTVHGIKKGVLSSKKIDVVKSGAARIDECGHGPLVCSFNG